jgi:hypothetical protein
LCLKYPLINAPGGISADIHRSGFEKGENFKNVKDREY